MDLDRLREINPDAVVFNDLDEAVIGVDYRQGRVIYDQDKILEVLQNDQDMTLEEAVEWFEFNIGCFYSGENTPIILVRGVITDG